MSGITDTYLDNHELMTEAETYQNVTFGGAPCPGSELDFVQLHPRMEWTIQKMHTLKRCAALALQNAETSVGDFVERVRTRRQSRDASTLEKWDIHGLQPTDAMLDQPFDVITTDILE